MFQEPDTFIVLTQISQWYQAVPMFIVAQEQCVVSHVYFPTSVFYFHQLVIKIQIRVEIRNRYIFPHASLTRT